MIFEQESRLIRRRPTRRPQYDEQFLHAATAMTPTEMWFEQTYAAPRRRRWVPPVEPTFAFRAPTAITMPTTFWLETIPPLIRRRARSVPWWLQDIWVPRGPAIIPPIPPAPPPTITQTIYASTSSLYQPAFAPPFAFVGASGQALIVGDARGVPVVVKAGTGVVLSINLSPTMGIGIAIATALVQLQEGSGADANPSLRLFGAPVIAPAGGRQRQGIRQTLVNLISGGQYVAFIMARLTDGSTTTFSAPFLAG